MADSKFKKGEDVYFLLEKLVGVVYKYKVVDWDENAAGRVVCRGQIIDIFPIGRPLIYFYYEIEIAEPYEFYGRTAGFPESCLSKNPFGDKLEAQKSVSVSATPRPTDRERMMKILGAPGQSEVGPPCPHCGKRMKPLASSWYCPDDCDKIH